MTPRSDRRTCGAMCVRDEVRDEVPASSRMHNEAEALSARSGTDTLMSLPEKLQELANSITHLGDRTQSLETTVAQIMPGKHQLSPREIMHREEMTNAARALQRCQNLPDGLRTATEALMKQNQETEMILQRILSSQLQMATLMERLHRDSNKQLNAHGQSLVEVKAGMTTLLDAESRAAQPTEQTEQPRSQCGLTIEHTPRTLRDMLPIPPMLPVVPSAQPEPTLDKSVQTELEIAVEDVGKGNKLGSLPSMQELMYAAVEPVDILANQGAPSHDKVQQGDTCKYIKSARESADLFTRMLVFYLNPPTGRWADIANSRPFVIMSCIIIVANTIALGIQTEINIENAIWAPIGSSSRANTDWFVAVNVVFLVLFVLELTVRIAAQRLFFFTGRNWQMNLFDFFLIVMSFFDEVGSIFFQAEDVTFGNLSFFRVIKIVRVLQTLRILRLFHYSGSLRVMAAQICSAVYALVWAFLLIALMIYCCSCFICQTLVHFFESGYYTKEYELHTEMQELYGTILRSMYTLVLAISGGMDWKDIIHPWINVSKVVVSVLMCYVLFVVFGMLNVLTGVFCDKARESGEADRDIIIESEKEVVMHYVAQLKQEFQNMDTDMSGTITWLEFRTYTQSEDVQAYLAHLGISVNDSLELFCILDRDNTGSVDLEMFIRGVLRMRGAASSIEMMKLDSSLSQVKSMLISIRDTLSTQAKSTVTPHADLHAN